jgi:uncharacterized protein YbjQ (UPF0145 family)
MPEIVKCLKCGEDAYAGQDRCPHCRSQDYHKGHRPIFYLTTAPSLEGYKVTSTIEIVTAECAFGMNLFSDFFAGLSDFFGGRNESTQSVLRDARTTCLNELRKEAERVGANAVIAVDLDYSEFSGKGKSMLFLVASGTAVKVEKIGE